VFEMMFAVMVDFIGLVDVWVVVVTYSLLSIVQMNIVGR